MGTPVSTTTDLATAAATAAKTAYQTNKSSNASAATSTNSSDALSSLTSNYNQFLTLLTAQLQNQDPTTPMTSDAFTSELAQFAGVEQQIATNTNLTQLLSLGQDSQVSQSSSLVGRQALVSSNQLPLQNGQASIQLNPTQAEQVGIAITDPSGAVVKTQLLTLPAGTTTWNWNGQNDAGATLPDGSYSVAVVTKDAAANTTPVTFDVIGTITGVTKSGTTGVNVDMGAASVDMSKVTSLLAAATASNSAAVSGGS